MIFLHLDIFEHSTYSSIGFKSLQNVSLVQSMLIIIKEANTFSTIKRKGDKKKVLMEKLIPYDGMAGGIHLIMNYINT